MDHKILQIMPPGEWRAAFASRAGHAIEVETSPLVGWALVEELDGEETFYTVRPLIVEEEFDEWATIGEYDPRGGSGFVGVYPGDYPMSKRFVDRAITYFKERDAIAERHAQRAKERAKPDQQR